ncbi:uncharacterized protein LOC126905686 isoform X2 [Daktulosphaira vitifoliae]|uniref:uncharacterized protein LOC126905686 isoform X2 n=1 Tax=Daktulosphaira vitifoliae TaxID=58002 RepID=UPI0021A983B4|nr:uncharacterized protein LOC126905686 isoform X2 [Daktulosphaira vitifoliae]
MNAKYYNDFQNNVGHEVKKSSLVLSRLKQFLSRKCNRIGNGCPPAINRVGTSTAGFEMYSYFASTATGGTGTGGIGTITVAPSCGGNQSVVAQAHFTGIQPAHHHQQQQQQQQQQQSVSTTINCSLVRAIAAAATAPSSMSSTQAVQSTANISVTSSTGKIKEMPKLVKLAPNGAHERSVLQQESKKRKRPIGKAPALATSKPLTIVAPTPIMTSKNEDSINSIKYSFTTQQTNPSSCLKKNDSTNIQCSQTTTIKTGVSGGNIPVGIAVARQRFTQSTSSTTEIQRQRETSTTTTVSMPEVISQTPVQTMVLSYNDCSMATSASTSLNRWPTSNGCAIPQNTIGGQWNYQNTTIRAPTIDQPPIQPVGNYQLVQDQSGQFFLLPQNSITGVMTMPFDYCKQDTQSQTNQGFTLIQQPSQQMATISPIINHPQYTSIASAGSYLIQQVSSSNPPALINTHHPIVENTGHQQPLLQLSSPENQMFIFNQQQSAIVAQPLIGHIQSPHSGLTLAQMQTGCPNQINDIQTVSESVTVQTKLVQQSITEKSTISSHTEKNLSISLDYCNTALTEPEKEVKTDFSMTETLDSNAIMLHDASNQTDLQTEDDIGQPLTEEIKNTDFIDTTNYSNQEGRLISDGGTQTCSVMLSIAENASTPDITGLELLLNSIEQFEKRDSAERERIEKQEELKKVEELNTKTNDNSYNKMEENEEKGVNKIDLLLLAEQFLETENSMDTIVQKKNIHKTYSNYKKIALKSERKNELCKRPLVKESNEITTKKEYTKKSPSSSELFWSREHLKGDKELAQDKLKKYSENNNKPLKRKLSDSSETSETFKRGPGRPKKFQKDDDKIMKRNSLKLDCDSRVKQKISISSSSDLSPPVLEPCSPFSSRKDSTRTPPTLSPISSAAKLSDSFKSSDEEKAYEGKVAKKRSTSLIVTSENDFRSPIKKRKVGRPRKNSSPFDEILSKHLSKNQNKEKQVPLSSGIVNSVATIKTNKSEISSGNQYKIKPKLKAEVKIKHWDVEDEDEEFKDPDDLLDIPEFVCKKRRMADALNRIPPYAISKPSLVVPKKRKFSSASFDSDDSLNELPLPSQKDIYNGLSIRSESTDSEVSPERTGEERDSSTTVDLAECQCTSVSPGRPNVEKTTADKDDYERKRLKKKRKHRKHKHSHDEPRIKHKHKHHKKHHKKHKRHRENETNLSLSEPPKLSPQTLLEKEKIDDDDDDKSNEENDSSEVDCGEMSKFLSDQQTWKWLGDSYKRPGRGGNKKTFYKSITRGDETIKVGDCAVFLSSGCLDRPFIGKVDCMWETHLEKMQVKVFWFYHPEETACGFTGDLPYPGALFKSPHNDINEVQSIMNGCRVISLKEFRQIINKEPERLDAIYENNDLFYLAGEYEPVMKMIKFSDGVMPSK